MASPAVLDIKALLEPIPNGDPAGSVLSFLRDQLEEGRKDEEPHPDDPSLPPVPRKVDWTRIIDQTTEALQNRSKDLRLACYLTEAAVRQHGFAGLRDGLQLLCDLVDQCWDRLLPRPEEDEGIEIRAVPFQWLTDPDRGALFANTLRRAPLIRLKERPATYSLQDWKQSQKTGAPITRAEMSLAEPATSEMLEDVAQILAVLNRLDELLNDKLGRINAPNWSNLAQVLDECTQLLQQVGGKQAAAMGGNNRPAGAGLAGGAGTTTRDEVYRQIAELAQVLAELEPHSPIPDLLRRAVELGKMSFRSLIQELIREPNTLSELRREFGLKEAEAAVSEPPLPES